MFRNERFPDLSITNHVVGVTVRMTVSPSSLVTPECPDSVAPLHYDDYPDYPDIPLCSLCHNLNTTDCHHTGLGEYLSDQLPFPESEAEIGY